MNKLERISTSEAETKEIGMALAMAIQTGSGQGDLLLLSGDLGVGKTVLARSIIQHLYNDETLEVPSPTYLICQNYEGHINISHYDLYRISSVDELDELGFEEAFDTGCVIIEWPQNAKNAFPKELVRISFNVMGENQCKLVIEGNGDFFKRIQRSFKIVDFLDAVPLKNYTRQHFSADASARSYEIITEKSHEYFLMNAPQLPTGPIVYDGKSYSTLAHLARSVTPFVAIAKIVREAGFCAPNIPTYDLDEGILLIDHLGSEGIIDENRHPIKSRYMLAMEFLADLHTRNFNPNVVVNDSHSYTIPSYDETAMLVEADLLTQWYAPYQSGKKLEEAKHQEFLDLWEQLYWKLTKHEQTLVLRDFHSPNVLWLEENEGVNKIGVIDFQDALIGPSSYDVASIAQDARVDVSVQLEDELVAHYIACRKAKSADFDEVAFLESYAIMAAQRASKVMGIFVRLNERDGKTEYMKHLPRMTGYMKKSLKHPVLSTYKTWLEQEAGLL